MNEDQIAGYKERLLEEQNRLEREVENTDLFTLGKSQSDSIQELSTYDNHPADLGSETFEREKDLALLNNLHEQQERIAEALGRMEQGTYGICEACGREIDRERLNALPSTTFCISCQRMEEDRFINRERPIEEEVLTPPFQRDIQAEREMGMVTTDGEDIWQRVARYGSSDSPSDVGGANSYDDAFYDAEEDQGIVEMTDAIIDVGPDEIPPDPDTYKWRGR